MSSLGLHRNDFCRQKGESHCCCSSRFAIVFVQVCLVFWLCVRRLYFDCLQNSIDPLIVSILFGLSLSLSRSNFKLSGCQLRCQFNVYFNLWCFGFHILTIWLNYELKFKILFNERILIACKYLYLKEKFYRRRSTENRFSGYNATVMHTNTIYKEKNVYIAIRWRYWHLFSKRIICS